MKKKYKVNHKESLRKTFQRVLPGMFNDFMAYKEKISEDTHGETIIHKMRIAGKPLRYLMEIKAKKFGKDYLKCHEEIKEMIELMGEIHDCDVMIPEIMNYAGEIKLLNVSRSVESISVQPLTNF